MKVTVLGAGAWGTALAKLLYESKHNVTLWGHNPEHVEQIRRTGRNEPYLPGQHIGNVPGQQAGSTELTAPPAGVGR